MFLVDSHCHLPLLAEEIGLDQVLENARQNNVGHMLCVSIDLESFPQVLSLAKQYEAVSASFGIHPNTSIESEPDWGTLVELASDPDVVAIGETGLDYFRSQGDLEWQRDRFRNHIQLAKQVKKPLIIHTREAKDDVVRILKEEGADAVGGVMHCFVDDLSTAEQAMELGFYISFSGIVTFKNAQDLKTVAKQVPLGRLLVETDSPYLAPVPYRGKTNQPAYVTYVATHIAELKEMPIETIVQTTTDNYYGLFKAL